MSHRVLDEREQREKEEAINLLRQQMKIEGLLVGLYEKTVSEIESKPVQHLLRAMQFDSRKHVDICQAAIENLEGEDVLKEEKDEILESLNKHIELEKDSIDRANNILKNIWIRENKGLSDLIEKLRDDERRHHEALRKLVNKPFFRIDSKDLYTAFRETEWLEERYRRSRDFRRKQEKAE